MKTYRNLFKDIVTLPNLSLAERKARRGKSKKTEVIEFNKCRTDSILNLYFSLKNGSYRVSEYYHFTIFEPKKRLISKLSYVDNIVHHAILNILEPIFVSKFIHQTFNCIKDRGILKCSQTIRKYLKDRVNTKYCLKLDISKFYQSVNNEILKTQLEKLIKDEQTLNLLYLTIEKTTGLTLGNYTSQWLGNFYLNDFDNWLKRVKKVKYYTRYCDDLVILSSDKQYLYNLKTEIKDYLHTNLKLKLSNYQVFEVGNRGIDYVGYKHFHNYTLLRKSIKQKWKKMLKNNPNKESKASYNGWLSHCNSENLRKKYLKEFVN